MKEEKQIYDMVDGIPIWQHLKNGGTDSELELISTDFGKFAEILGNRLLNKLTKKGGILDKIFPNITIISVHRLPRLRVLYGKKIELGDFVIEVDYIDPKFGNGIFEYGKNSRFGKKIVLFEIKYGRFQIEQNQIRRYSFMIDNPGEYYPKADELKIFFLLFDKIDTMNCNTNYSICEFTKDIAQKIVNSTPIKEWDGKFGKYDHMYIRIKNGMEKLFS